MKTLRTILSATALILAAGAANAAPAANLAGNAPNIDAGQNAVTTVGWHVHRVCRLRFGFHFHPFHGWHYGPHRRCFRYVHWVP